MDNTNHTTHSVDESEAEIEAAQRPKVVRKTFIAPDVSDPITVGSLTLAASTTGAGGPGGGGDPFGGSDFGLID